MEFSGIQQILSEVSRESLILQCLLDLQTIQKDKERKYPHWKYLVLIKWAYQFGGKEDGPGITTDQWKRLMEGIEKLETSYSGLHFTDEAAVRKSFRIIAFQQFAHQELFYQGMVSRQVVLYQFTKTDQLDIAGRFRELTGLDLNDFFRYSFFLAIYFFGWEHPYDLDALHADFLDLFARQYGYADLQRFLWLLTIRGKDDVDVLQRMSNEQLQLFETNLFVTKPLLFFMGNFVLPHQSLLTQSVKHFVYTYMKMFEPRFCDELGLRMEEYLQMGLQEVRIPYKREAELIREYGEGKVSDFLAEESILIECKATQLHPRSGILRSPGVMAGDLKTSVVKGYVQLLSMASRMPKEKEWLGVIVTYGDMYLGFGDDAWDEFLKEAVAELLPKENISIEILPPGNIFFMSLEDWDHSMQVVKEGRATLREMLIMGRELNHHPNPAEQVFMMDQVLQKHYPIEQFTLSYLKRAEAQYDLELTEDN